MEATTYVGLDVHRKTVVATAKDPMGRSTRHSTFGPTRQELTDFLSEIPGTKKVVLEACSFWERYYDAAISTGAEVVVSHPLKTRLIAEASLKIRPRLSCSRPSPVSARSPPWRSWRSSAPSNASRTSRS